MPQNQSFAPTPHTLLNQAQRINAFFSMHPHKGPLLALDLNTVQNTYQTLLQAMPYASIFYAIKANDHPDLLALLSHNGASFDAASLGEIKMALNAGAPPHKISFGNTIKKSSDIKAAYDLGIRIFAFDSQAELEKIAAHAPNSLVYCRILFDGKGAKWPLSRKFGCTPKMATRLLKLCPHLNLIPWGLSFHVGSQQQHPKAWDKAIKTCAQIFKKLPSLTMLNMGGGLPAKYDDNTPDIKTDLAPHITHSLNKHFNHAPPPTVIIEPGRSLVANAGVIRAEVILISHKSDTDKTRWVYLDIGLFSGLNEAGGETLRYPIITPHEGTPTSPAILAGPTCDSADILYERTPVMLPDNLAIGDYIYLLNTGAYTTSYATAGFNGFAPLKARCIK